MMAFPGNTKFEVNFVPKLGPTLHLDQRIGISRENLRQPASGIFLQTDRETQSVSFTFYATLLCMIF